MRFLPDVLKSLRKSKGYSLGMAVRLLEARVGYKVSRSAVCHWENGDFLPSLESLMAIAELYEVDMNKFFVKEADSSFSSDTLFLSTKNQKRDQGHESAQARD
jgi:transcriptional regulator with XRE-family HTH domain